MRKVKFIIPLLLILSLVACAGQQITKDQEARIILNGIQDNLSTLFDTGKAYILAKPQYQEVWKNNINPAFDIANKSVATALDLAKKGQYTPADVQAKITPLVNSIISLLAQIGAI